METICLPSDSMHVSMLIASLGIYRFYNFRIGIFSSVRGGAVGLAVEGAARRHTLHGIQSNQEAHRQQRALHETRILAQFPIDHSGPHGIDGIGAFGLGWPAAGHHPTIWWRQAEATERIATDIPGCVCALCWQGGHPWAVYLFCSWSLWQARFRS